MIAAPSQHLLLLLLLGALLPNVSTAASMDTHSIVGQRALDFYGSVLGTAKHNLTQVIRRHPNAVLGGSDFPDFLYACGKYTDHHDAGEVSHWPVFQAVAANYIRTQPSFHDGDVAQWTPDLQQLVSFVFGFTIHYVCDELWEGLTAQLSSAGFIEMVDGVNLGLAGHGDQQENIGNQAADFYAAWILNQSNIHPWDRFFPTQDIVNIYHLTPEANYGPGLGNFTNVTLQSLTECKVVFDLGLWATQEFGALLYPLWARDWHQIPFAQEHLFDQPLSGIEDMAAITR